MNAEVSYRSLISCIRLIRTPNVGPVAFHRLVRRYKSPETALDALECGEFGSIQNICTKGAAELEVELCRAAGARIICIFEEAYPEMLLNIYDPPPVITVLGNQDLIRKDNKIAMVGSRNASVNGRRIAYGIASDLSNAGFVTISGLARGIDSAVHSVALEGMPTIAVVANGVNVVYPRENLHLHKAIVRNGGTIISELPFSSLPKANLFPKRNRIISGISKGVVVVEASKRSGSLITANLALSQGREVFAVPGSVLDPGYAGSNDLIKQGAVLVRNAEDVIQALDFSFYSVVGDKKDCVTATRNSTGNTHLTERHLTEVGRTILQKLGSDPTDIEDLAACTNIGISTLLATLVELELLQKVARLPGNRFILTRK
ncbi:MAG: DNA-processing protein DprA [Anaplasma sp.]